MFETRDKENKMNTKFTNPSNCTKAPSALRERIQTEILHIHCAQALSYLKASGLRLAIVLNFGGQKLTQERIVL